MARDEKPLLSVVAPCRNEEGGLEEFCRRTSAACRGMVGDAFEIVLVDDGSTDDTWGVISRLADKSPGVVGVRLMRNHGHQLAATAGLATATGDRIMLIDADLQDPPELIPEMMRLMDAGADVVYGKRQTREGETAFKKVTASLFYQLLARLSDIPVPRDTGDFRLMRRRVVDILLAMPERDRFIRGMVSWIGGRQVPLLYERKPRIAGRTKYNLSRMARFAADAFTSFSIAPLRLATWLGVTFAGFAFLLLAYTIITWAAGHIVPGWTSTMASIAFFSGVQLLVLGLMGEYLGRLVSETKGRPLFLIDVIKRRGSEMAMPVEFSRMPRQAREATLEAFAGRASTDAAREDATAAETRTPASPPSAGP